MRRAFSAIAILYGCGLGVVACTTQLPAMQWTRSPYISGTAFCIAALLFVPLVVTFTRLGLNSAADEVPTRATRERLDRLSEEVPIWNFLWSGAIVLVIFSWAIAPQLALAIDPFYTFAAVASLLSGCWFALVYPRAKNLFSIPSVSKMGSDRYSDHSDSH